MTALGNFVQGEKLTAADMNAIGTYTAFTPTWAAGLTVGNGTNDFYYSKVNKIVHIWGRFTLGSTSAVTGLINMTLPFARVEAGVSVLGTGGLGDAGTATYLAYPISSTTTNCLIFALATGGATALETQTNATTPFTWVATDFIHLNLIYRAA